MALRGAVRAERQMMYIAVLLPRAASAAVRCVHFFAARQLDWQLLGCPAGFFGGGERERQTVNTAFVNLMEHEVRLL